jgi:hypothetical protein
MGNRSYTVGAGLAYGRHMNITSTTALDSMGNRRISFNLGSKESCDWVSGKVGKS